MTEMVTITIESDGDDDVEEIEVPEVAVEILGEGESASQMAGDLVVLGLTQQLHASVFHTDEAPRDAVKEANESLGESFEERFGMSFEEMADHSHE